MSTDKIIEMLGKLQKEKDQKVVEDMALNEVEIQKGLEMQRKQFLKDCEKQIRDQVNTRYEMTETYLKELLRDEGVYVEGDASKMYQPSADAQKAPYNQIPTPLGEIRENQAQLVDEHGVPVTNRPTTL